MSEDSGTPGSPTQPVAPPTPSEPVRRQTGAAVTAFISASALILALGTYEFMILPMQRELDLTVDQANATNLIPAAASLLVVFASSGLSDRFGYRRLLLIGSALYAIGALMVALAPGYVLVVSGRALGGLGGATMGVVGLAMVNTIFTDPARRAKAFAAFAALIPAVSFVFPPVGAYLTEHVSWRAVPLLWMALGALAFVLSLVFVPRSFGSVGGGQELVTPVIAGVILAGVALAATIATSDILYAVLLLAVSAVALLAIVLLRKLRNMRGLDLRLMRSPGVWAVIWAIVLLSGANLYFFTSLLLQYRFDDPITFIAIIMCIPEAAALVGCFVSGWAASRYGALITAAVCILLAGLGALLSVTVGATATIYHPVAILTLVAAPSAAAVGPLTQTFMDLAPHDGSSAPAAMRDALQSLGSNLGGIIAGTVGLIAFARYTTGALVDAGLDPSRANEVAYGILDGTHVNELAKEPWMPAHVADLIAGSRLILHTGQSVAYWAACLAASAMCFIAAVLMFRFARRHPTIGEIGRAHV